MSISFILMCFISISVLASNDVSWQSVGPGCGGAMTVIAIDPKNENVIYIGTDLGGVFKTTDGKNFNFINNGLNNLRIQQIVIDPKNTNNVFLGVHGGLHKSTDGGLTWARKTSGFIPAGSNYNYPVKAIAIDPKNSNIMYAAYAVTSGNSFIFEKYMSTYGTGQIYKSTDAGESWSVISTGSSQIKAPSYVYELLVSCAHSNIIFATTETGFYKSIDGGVNWVKKNTGLPLDPARGLAQDPKNPEIIYITLETPTEPWQGGVYKSQDGGETWEQKISGLYIRHVESGGATSNFGHIVVNPVNTNILYAGDRAWGCSVSKSADSADSWTQAINYKVNHEEFYSSALNVRSLAISQSNPNVVIIGNGLCLYRSVDGGSNWKLLGQSKVGTDRWKTDGIENTCVFNFALKPNDSKVVYFSYADIGPFKSEDGGFSVKTIRDGLGSFYPDVTSMAFDPDDPSIMYCAGNTDNDRNYSAIMKSDNSGGSWSIIGNELTGYPTAQGVRCPILIDPQTPKDSRTIYVGKYGGGIYKTIDGGKSWFASNTGLPSNSLVKALVMDPKNPKIIYLGTAALGQNGSSEYGGLYKSANGGASWYKIENRDFVNIRTLIIDPRDSSVIYAGAEAHWDDANSKSFKGGVFKSTDGGLKWNMLLEDAHILSVALNPSYPDVIYAGGGISSYSDKCCEHAKLYKSNDGGKNWKRIDSDLPGRGISFSAISVSPNDPRVIFAGTDGGGAFKGFDSSIHFAPSQPTGLKIK